MNACNVLLPGGINGDCQIALSEVKNIWLCDKDVKFSYAAKGVQSNWTDLINQSLQIYGAAGLDSYNNTTDDPNIVTGAVSKAKKITNVPLPSFEFFLDTSFCDFKEILNTVKGGNYGMFYELHDEAGMLGATDTTGAEIGYFKPFQVNATANSKLLQETDATTAFRLYVNHTKAKQLYNQFIFNPVWDIGDLLDSMPNGLSLVATAVYAAGVQNVQVKDRCAANKTGVVLVDWDETEELGNVSTPAVTAIVDNGAGNYDLTVEKSVVPEDLVDNDVAAIRVNIVSGSNTTDISGYVYVQGITP
jgi:hypothetical protein